MTQTRTPPMKESGTVWLGRIPQHWELSRIGSCFEERKTTVSDTDYEPLSVTKNGVIPQLDSAAKSDNNDARKLIKAGDFVINSRSDRKGSSGLASVDGSTSVIYTVLKPRNMYGPYVHHLLRSEPFQEEFYRWGSGIVADLWSTRYAAMKQIPNPVPPFEEQEEIARFLDRETAQIDALIEKQKELIEALDERRKAVVARAVTRGLDSKVQLKESGVDWLGKIPQHWTAQTFRRIGQLESGADYKEFEVEDGGFPVIGSGGEFRRVSKYMFEGESVLFGRKGTIDRPLYVNCAFWTVDTMYWTRLNSNVIAKFIYYWATTLPFKQFTTNTALPSMTSSDIKNFEIALPPKNEQLEISNFLDQATGAIHSLSQKAQEMIEVLQERRQALISAAVTGKIDVRGK